MVSFWITILWWCPGGTSGTDVSGTSGSTNRLVRGVELCIEAELAESEQGKKKKKTKKKSQDIISFWGTYSSDLIYSTVDVN